MKKKIKKTERIEIKIMNRPRKIMKNFSFEWDLLFKEVFT
jgi:hypothetical protein